MQICIQQGIHALDNTFRKKQSLRWVTINCLLSMLFWSYVLVCFEISLLLIHLSNGPTAFFKLSSFQPGDSIPGHGKPTSHIPEVILNNFTTRLGRRLGRFLGSLFPHVRYLLYVFDTFLNLIRFWLSLPGSWLRRTAGCNFPQPKRLLVCEAPSLHL